MKNVWKVDTTINPSWQLARHNICQPKSNQVTLCKSSCQTSTFLLLMLWGLINVQTNGTKIEKKKKKKPMNGRNVGCYMAMVCVCCSHHMCYVLYCVVCTQPIWLSSCWISSHVWHVFQDSCTRMDEFLSTCLTWYRNGMLHPICESIYESLENYSIAWKCVFLNVLTPKMV